MLNSSIVLADAAACKLAVLSPRPELGTDSSIRPEEFRARSRSPRAGFCSAPSRGAVNAFYAHWRGGGMT